MAYKRVYAPSGEPFDVPEIRANDLILQKGWTQQPQQPQQPPVAVVPVVEDLPEVVEEDSDDKPKRRRRTKAEFGTAE